MLKTVIVGAGISGLVLAKRLRALNIDVNGVERETKPGGGLEYGHHRLYTEEGLSLLNEDISGLEWVEIQDAPMQVKKGEFSREVDPLSEPEAYYLGHPFFSPKVPYSTMIDTLANHCRDVFQFRCAVTSVDLERKTLVCLNGTEIPFQHLIWTESLASLAKAADSTPLGLAKAGKPLETGGISWDIQIGEQLFDGSNTLVFPFRYKDLRLKALGIQEQLEAEYKCHWMVFLEDSLMENHEELAKIFRAFKRELTRQFPILEKGPLRERLAYHPSLSGVVPVSATSLEVFEGVACTGADVQTEEVAPDPRKPLRNLDLILRNTLDVLDLVIPKWQKTEAGTPKPAKTSTAQAEATY